MPTEVAQEAPALAPGIRQGNAWKAIRDEASRTERKANAVTALSGRSTADLRRPNAPKAQPSFGRKGTKKDTKVQQDLLLHLPVVLKLQRRLREIRQKHMYKHNDAPLISENVQDLLDEEHSTRRRLNNGEFELTSKGQLLSDLSSHTAGAIGNSLEGAPMKNRVNTMKLLSSGVQRLFGVLAQLTTLGERVMHPLHLLPCIERAAAELIPDCAAVVYDVLAGQSVDAKRRDKSSAGTLVSINRYLKIEAKALPCTCEAVIKSRQAIWHDSAKSCPALAYAEVWRSEESGTTFGSATGAIMGFFFDGEYESMVRQQIAEQGFNIRVDRSRGHLASSIVATPMLDEVGQAQAVLFTHHRKGRGFSADDALILKLLCATAGEILRTAKQISRAMDANVKLTNTIQDVRQHCWEVKDMQNVAKRVIPSDDCLVLTLSGAEKTDLRPLVDCSLATRFFDALKTEMLNTGVSKEAVELSPTVCLELEPSGLFARRQQQTGNEKSVQLGILQQLSTPETPTSKWRSLLMLPILKPTMAFFEEGHGMHHLEADGSPSSTKATCPNSKLTTESGAGSRKSKVNFSNASNEEVEALDEGAAIEKDDDARRLKTASQRSRRTGIRTDPQSRTMWRTTAHLVSSADIRRRDRRGTINQRSGSRTHSTHGGPIAIRSGQQGLEGAMIWMNRCQDRFQFDPDDEVEAERFGQLSMTTISFIMEAAESALTKTALSHALKQKNALVETAKLLSGNLDILALFSATMTHAKDIMEVDRSTLFLYDKESHELWSKVADGAAPIRIPASAGIAGAVCTSRSVINIPDAYADSRFNQEIDKQTGYKTKTILAVPILSASGEMLGVLQLINKLTALGFSVEDVKLVDAFTSQIAIGISNCLAYEEVSIKHAALTRQMHQIEELLDVAVVLTQQIEFKPLCSAFKMCASRLAEASNTEVFVVDEAEGTIMQAAVAAGLEGRTYSISILCRENRPNMVSVAARCVAMAGVENDCSVLIRGQPLASLIGCILFVPLRSGRTGKLVGVLAAARDIGIFSKEQITWLTTLAEVGAIALESMQHYEQLDHKLARAELKTQRYQALLKLNRGICAGEGSTFKWDAFAATKQLLTCLDATSCTLYVIDWRQGVLHTRGSEHPYSRLAFPMNRGLLGMVARTGIPVNLEDATIHAAYDPVVDAAVSMFAVRHPSLLIVPVMGSLGQVLGVLQAVGKKSHEAAAVANQKKGPQKASQSRSFGKDDEEFMVQCSAQMAVVFELEAHTNDRSLVSLTGDFRASDELVQVEEFAPRITVSREVTPRPPIAVPPARTPRTASAVQHLRTSAVACSGPASEARPSTAGQSPASPQHASLSIPRSPRHRSDVRALPALQPDMTWPKFDDKPARRPCVNQHPLPTRLARSALSPRQPVVAHTKSLPRPPAETPHLAAHVNALAHAAHSVLDGSKLTASDAGRRASTGPRRSSKPVPREAETRSGDSELADASEACWEDLFATVRHLTDTPATQVKQSGHL